LDKEDDNINEFEELTDELNALREEDTDPLSDPTELLADELYTVIVPLIEEDTLVIISKEAEVDELINVRVPFILLLPPVNNADCVTSTGT
jgi:hypothetical protein